MTIEPPSSTSHLYSFYHYACQGMKLIIRITPRAAVGHWVGITGLGICYRRRIMMEISFRIMDYVYHHFGHAGVGQLMPRIDWYLAQGVYLIFSAVGAVSYDITERVILAIWTKLFPKKNSTSISLQTSKI